MAEYDEAVSILRNMEQNQLKTLEMQAEHLAIVKAQLERTEARLQESISIQKATVTRYARITNVLVPIVLVALLVVFYMLFKYA